MRTIYIFILLNLLCTNATYSQKAYLYETKMPYCCDYFGHTLGLKDGPIIYTLMETYSNIDNDLVRSVKIIKLSNDGQLAWMTGYKALKPYIYRMTPFFENDNGDIFFFGKGGKNGHHQILKMNSSGEVLWIKSYFLNFVFGEFSSGIGHSDGNLILTGSVSYDTKTKGMIAAITQDGEVLWVRLTKNADIVSPEEMFILRVIENKKGNLVVFGHGYSGSKKKRFLCLSELDKSGKTIWTNAYFRNTVAAVDYVYDLCETDTGYTVVGCLGSATNESLMMAVNADGTMLWNKNYRSKLMQFTNVFWRKEYVNDYFVFGQDYYNLYLFRIDPDGEIKKARLMSNGGNSIVSDYFLPTQDGGYITFNTTFKLQNNVAEGSARLLKLNQQSEFACKSEEVDLSKIEIKSLDLYDDDEEYIFESTSCKVEDWTDYELIEADIQFEIICETTATTDVSTETGALRLYPNPVSSTLSIDVRQAGYSTVREQTVDITDLLGRKLYTVDIDNEGHAEVDTQTLPPGMYIAVLRADGHQVQTVKFVVVRSEK